MGFDIKLGLPNLANILYGDNGGATGAGFNFTLTNPGGGKMTCTG